MTPLSDRSVIVLVTATLGLVFALVFWFLRFNPPADQPLLWKEAPQPGVPRSRPDRPAGTLL